ncbi:MAG: acyl-CoA dehydrogenase family protein, partial [Actinomycetota bacterium]
DRGLDLARRATDSLVAASGGGAMSLDHPAQRLSREATFYLIQAQTGDLRAATLARTIRA